MQRLRFVDIAVNLLDCVFRGVGWNGKQLHRDDFDEVLARAKSVGVEKIVISGTHLEQCERAVTLCRQHPGFLFCTIGVHPAHCAEFLTPMPSSSREANGASPAMTIKGPPEFTEKVGENAVEAARALIESNMANVSARLVRLSQLVEANRDVVVAVGEIGLDYTELKYCPAFLQQEMFRRQLELAAHYDLPLFLHSRDCGMEFVEAMRSFSGQLARNGGGVVHSFTGSQGELLALVHELDLHIGINASAFRTEPLAKLCCSSIPRHRLLLETDAPWCDVRAGHYGEPFVKSKFPTCKKEKFKSGHCVERRNEPCHIVQVLEMYVGCANALADDTKGSERATEEAVSEQIVQNAAKLFRWKDRD